jgi:hypothetical protein
MTPHPTEFGDVPFTLGGRVYTARFGNLAWFILERAYETPEKKVRGAAACLVEARKSKDNLLAFLRAGLARHHPDLTDAEIWDLYDRIPAVGEKSFDSAILEAIKLTLPELFDEEEEGPDPNAPPAPTSDHEASSTF